MPNVVKIESAPQAKRKPWIRLSPTRGRFLRSVVRNAAAARCAPAAVDFS
jgi:hypothetical protein